MLTSSWCGQLCQRFYSISLTLNKNLERIPLIQHYRSTGGLIIFHGGAAEILRRQIQNEGKTDFSSDRASAVKPKSCTAWEAYTIYTLNMLIWATEPFPRWPTQAGWASISNLAFLWASENKALVDWDESLHQRLAPRSLFEAATDVLLFMQSRATETTSGALCDPHSADLKELLTAKFNRGQKYTKATAVSSRLLILCRQST